MQPRALKPKSLAVADFGSTVPGLSAPPLSSRQVTGRLSNSARVAWIWAAALVVFIAWVATDTGANVGIGFFYVVPIGLAAWWGGARWAAIAVPGCIVLYNVGAMLQPLPDFGLTLALRVIVFLAVAVLVCLVRERLKTLEHSARELSDLQAALTPSKLMDLPDVDAGASFAPSTEAGESGDFYMLTNAPDGSALAIVGNVLGDGADIGSLAMFVRARFAGFAVKTGEPAELLAFVNHALIKRSGPGRALVRAIALRFCPEAGELSWAIAGHPPPLRLPRLQELRPPEASIPLGVGPDLRPYAVSTSLDTGEGVLVYTDGAINVRQGGSVIGTQQLTRLLKPLVLLPASGIATQAKGAILDWADEPIRKDFCLLVLKPKRQPS